MFEAFDGLKEKKKYQRYLQKLRENEGGASGGGPLGKLIQIAIADEMIVAHEKTEQEARFELLVERCKAIRDSSW